MQPTVRPRTLLTVSIRVPLRVSARALVPLSWFTASHLGRPPLPPSAPIYILRICFEFVTPTTDSCLCQTYAHSRFSHLATHPEVSGLGWVHLSPPTFRDLFGFAVPIRNIFDLFLCCSENRFFPSSQCQREYLFTYSFFSFDGRGGVKHDELGSRPGWFSNLPWHIQEQKHKNGGSSELVWHCLVPLAPFASAIARSNPTWLITAKQ